MRTLILKCSLYACCVVLCLQLFSCKSYSPVPIDEKPQVKIDRRLLGIWKLREDTDKHNYFIIETLDSFHYNMSYMNHGGDNPWLERWPGYISEINKERFLNVTYSNFRDEAKGYFFLKLVEIEERGFHMKAQVLKDTTLKSVVSSFVLKQYIKRNLDNPAFYGDTLHFDRLFALEFSFSKK